MTDRTVDAHTALLAFEIIRTKGDQKNGEYLYEGFTASTDFDGYTVFIKDNKVSLTLMFHNKYDVQFEKREDLDKFLDRLYAITKSS